MTDFDIFDIDGADGSNEEFEVSLDILKEDGEQVLELMAVKEDLENQLKEIEGSLNFLIHRKIPYMMDEMGMPDFTIGDTKFTLKEKVSGSINRAPDFNFAKQYVIDAGAGDLIKTNVTTIFGKGAHNEAMALAQSLRDKGLDVKAEETIHAASYAAWGRELLADYNEAVEASAETGEVVDPIPFEKLGLYRARVAEVKQKKKKGK